MLKIGEGGGGGGGGGRENRMTRNQVLILCVTKYIEAS